MGSAAYFAEPRPASLPEKTDPHSLSKKGDTEGFIRGTSQGNSSSNSAESFQFGAKSQIASHYPVNREGRRILNFRKCFLKFQIEKSISLKLKTKRGGFCPPP
jgi:hypothetical protein